MVKINEGGQEFLKKLWCCVGGEVVYKNLVLSTELIMLIGPRPEILKADVSSVSPSSERIQNFRYPILDLHYQLR